MGSRAILEFALLFPALLGLLCERYDFIGVTVQNYAEAFQGEHGNALVVTKVVDCTGIDAVFIYQGISRNPTHFHRVPQRFIADQCFSPW